jgi:dCMP deaminase
MEEDFDRVAVVLQCDATGCSEDVTFRVSKLLLLKGTEAEIAPDETLARHVLENYRWHLQKRGEKFVAGCPAHSILSEAATPRRPSWDQYFMEMARLVSTRSTCARKHVGAVLVRDKRVLATGYNGSLAGQPHCDEVGHDLVKLADGTENCLRASHAEQNSISQAAKQGMSVQGSTAYVNTFPCWPCAKLLISSGIARILFDDNYRNDARVIEACRQSGVELAQVKTDG